MPGIFGFWSIEPVEQKDSMRIMEKMIKPLRHLNRYREKVNYQDNFAGGVITNGMEEPDENFFHDQGENLTIMLQGKIYNIQKIAGNGSNSPSSLLNLYKKKKLTWLPQADGFFSIALYDANSNTLSLISDRFGFSPLYIYHETDRFFYSCEMKSILSTAKGAKEVDSRSVDEYFTFGYCLDNNTIFKNIKVLTPGTILEISPEGVNTIKYWHWNDIEPIENSLCYKESLKILPELWNEAFQSRFIEKPAKLGISLSGGLDSRAVLATVPDSWRPVETYTFGIEGCADEAIANEAAKVKNDNHTYISLYTDNWLENRIKKGVWWTDGQVSLLHLHALSLHRKLVYDPIILMTGFAGDLVFGGGYMPKKGQSEKKFAFKKLYKSKIVRKLYQDFPLGMDMDTAKKRIEEVFDKLGADGEKFAIHTRVRRFTINGELNCGVFCDVRNYFFENKLFEFLMGVPRDWRRDGKLYSDFLLENFPAYFENIPWQSINLPISAPESRKKTKTYVRDAYKLLHRIFPSVVRKPYSYSDYPVYLRKKKEQRIIKKLLLNKNAIWTNYLDPAKGRDLVEKFFQSRKYDIYFETMGLLITFESYLQQLSGSLSL